MTLLKLDVLLGAKLITDGVVQGSLQFAQQFVEMATLLSRLKNVMIQICLMEMVVLPNAR